MAHHIAYLTSLYARAGDTFIRREVEELRRLGWTVHTFSIRRADEGELVSKEIAREQATTDYVLERGPLALLAAFLRLSLRHPGRMLRAVRQARSIRWPGLRSCLWHLFYLLEASYLAERLTALQVRLLHCHISMNAASVAMLASTLSGIPFSMTVHGPHDFFAADQWALGKKIAASALTVCISSFGKSQCMLAAPEAHWHKLEVIHCGLDGELLARHAPPLPTQPRLVCVGRLCPEKGQVLLVEAVARIRDEGLPVELLLVGDGPSRPAIERAARGLGLLDTVRLVGWKGSEEVLRLVAESRALVLPSFAEGIPVVLMEAMALGRPVIATYVGGIAELVEAGRSGWLVPAGAVEPLVEAMRQALRAPGAEVEAMGRHGQERVRLRHDLSREVGRLSELLARACERPSP